MWLKLSKWKNFHIDDSPLKESFFKIFKILFLQISNFGSDENKNRNSNKSSKETKLFRFFFALTKMIVITFDRRGLNRLS